MTGLLARRLLVAVLATMMLSSMIGVILSPDLSLADDQVAPISVSIGPDVIEPERPEQEPRVISLSGGESPEIPDFVYQDDQPSQKAASQSTFMISSESDPNITHIYWQNITTGSSGEWVTWMQPGGQVRIWFEVKGPILLSGEVVTVSFDPVVSKSSDYGSYLAAADLNSYGDIGVNESIWFYWDHTLPDELAMNYGWGTGQVNAFTLRLYHPIIYPMVTPYYEGLYDEYSYLNMYGKVRVTSVGWHNLTGYDEISVAEKGWYVSPWYTISVDNAPVWDVSFQTEWRADVVWWPDSHIGWSANNPVTGKILPGEHSVYPRPSPGSSSWLFYRIDPNEAYGTGIGQRRGLYCKLFVSGDEIYSSNNEGALLYVVDEIQNQRPQIQIISPLNGEAFTEPSLVLDVFVSDPNSNYDIESILLYNDGVASDITSIYNEIQGRITSSVDLPQSGNVVNLTIYACDSRGLDSSATVLILSDDPFAYFPNDYIADYSHQSLTFLEYEFSLENRLTFEPGADVNFTLTPRVTFVVTPTIEFDLYTGTPESVSAGDNYTTYTMISRPRLSLNIDFKVEVDYSLRLSTFQQQGTIVLFEKHWSASRSLWLGVDVLDLRYDLPGVSEYIQPFTHYEIELLSAFPIISSFASVKLTVDIVPLLKISNVLSADIIGVDCTPLLSHVDFVSERMFAIQSTVPSTASGSSCRLEISNMEMNTAVGFDLSADLMLSGSILTYTLMEVNLNDWMFDHLGIVVPSLSIWRPILSIPLAGTISIPTNIEPQILQPKFMGLSADESYINITLQVEDENGNAIPAADLSAAVGLESCSVLELGGGTYLILIPFRETEFALSITCSKSGYYGNGESYDIYVDPYVVDSTPPSISGLTRTPESPTNEDNVAVRVSINDPLTGIVDPTLYYSTDGGQSWQAVDMTLVSGTMYEATIPLQLAGTEVLYYVQVSDGAGNSIASSQNSYIVASSAITTTPTTTTETTTTTSETPSTTSGTPSEELIPDPLMTLGLALGGAGAVVIVVVAIIMKRRSRES